MSAEDVKKLGAKVDELVKAGDKIASVRKPWQEVAAYMEKHGQACTKAFLEGRVNDEAIRHNTSLKEIRLGGNQIGDVGATALAEAERDGLTIDV